MSYPNNLSNVATFKIHPAIGVARVANNPSINADYYYEFFAQRALPASDRKYMSDVNGVPTMKRQAVQFKVFAYDANLNELGELTPEIMQSLGIKATWSASLGNRKIYNYGQKGGTPKNQITASGSATGSEVTDLQGVNPFDSSKKVSLGSINGTGLFIPGEAGVMRETPDSKISRFPADQGQPLNTSDTTSDGIIALSLSDTDVPVIPASVICAAQEHSPDVDVEELLNSRTRIPDNPVSNNKIWTKVMSASDKLNIPYPPPAPANEGEKMDAAMNATMNGDFFPGVENNFDYNGGRTEFTNQAGLNNLFYPRGINFIGDHEIRPKYSNQNTIPGQLTSGLCSTWQGDLVACLSFWTAEYPSHVASQPNPPGSTKYLFREKCDSTRQISTPDDINEFADQMGVSRNDSNDPRVIHFNETERNCTT